MAKKTSVKEETPVKEAPVNRKPSEENRTPGQARKAANSGSLACRRPHRAGGRR